MVDRTILGIDHLYRRPVYARTKECSIDYPENGPLPPDAPSWCQAPFNPEGLLRSLHYGDCHLLDRALVWACNYTFRGIMNAGL
ncbi:hypothetical protein Zm00014a_042628 [Zea mays]|uniref:Uncharacterized protein n=1 Tax=Zea mays TaxID=4577 RepID=A0A3L6FID9_MAIZE|nr:hypothetical protein Zm00014a_042628 [Zea mays]